MGLVIILIIALNKTKLKFRKHQLSLDQFKREFINKIDIGVNENKIEKNIARTYPRIIFELCHF